MEPERALPRGWMLAELSDVADINPETLRATTSPEYSFRYIDLSSVERGSVRWSDTRSMTFSEAPSRARRIVRAGDVLFGTVRPALQSHAYVPALKDGAVIASTGFAIIRSRPGVSSARFLLHYTLSEGVTAEARKAEVGSNYPAVNESDVRRFAMLVPSLSEQLSIAGILDVLDECVSKTEQLVAKLKQMKQGLLHDLLTCGIDEHGELRDPERHPQGFKDSSPGLLPVGWQELPCDTIAAAPICYGIVQAGPYVPHGPLVLTIGDLKGDFRTGLHRTSPRIDENYARSRVRPDDVLLSIKGTIGRVAVVPAWYEGNISRDIARLRVVSSVVPAFVRQYLLSPSGQRRLEPAVVGTTRAEVSIHVLRRLRIPIPPRAEQVEIARQLESADASIATTEMDLKKLRLLKQGLMDDLLTGRVRVTPLLSEATP